MPEETEFEMAVRLRRIFYHEELPPDTASRVRLRLEAEAESPPPRRRIWPVLVACAIGIPLMAMAPTLNRVIVTAIAGRRGNPGLYGAVGKAAWRPLHLVVSGGDGATLGCQAYYSDGWQTSLLCDLTATSQQNRALRVGGMYLQDSAGERVPVALGQSAGSNALAVVYTFFGSVTTGPAEIAVFDPRTRTYHDASFELRKTTQRPVRRVNNAGVATAGGVTVTIARFVAGPAATQVQWTASVPGSPLLLWNASGTPSLRTPGGWSATGTAAGGGAVDGVATWDSSDPLPGDTATVTLPTFATDVFVPVNSGHMTVTPLKPFAAGTVTVSPIPAREGLAFRVHWAGVDLTPSTFVLAASGDGGWWSPSGCHYGSTAPWCSQTPSPSGTLDLSFPEWPQGSTAAALRVLSRVPVYGPWRVSITLPPPARVSAGSASGS